MPGIALSPEKVLLARRFAYADAHRARLGVNYEQIPVNAPIVPVHSKDGVGRNVTVSDPVYAPNSYGGPHADPSAPTTPGSGTPTGTWCARRTRCIPGTATDQAGTMVRDVVDEAARARLVNNVAGHLSDGVSEPILARACEYRCNTDKETGDRIEAAVRSDR